MIYSNPSRGYTYTVREVSRRDSEHASDYQVEIMAQVKANDAKGYRYLVGQQHSLSGLIGRVNSLTEAVEAFYATVGGGYYVPGNAPPISISHTHTEEVLIRLYGADPRPCPPVASAKLEVTRTC